MHTQTKSKKKENQKMCKPPLLNYLPCHSPLWVNFLLCIIVLPLILIASV